MKVLIIGKGAREHAIALSLKKNAEIEKLFCAPGNGGTALIAENVNLNELDNNQIKNFAKQNEIDFVVVTPDNPLANGLVDALNEINIPCFGPTKKAAEIESSKIFAKKLMINNSIPTSAFEIFSDANSAISYVKNKNQYPIVIKADGLCYGKGVTVAKTYEQAVAAINDSLINLKFKQSPIMNESKRGSKLHFDSLISSCGGDLTTK